MNLTLVSNVHDISCQVRGGRIDLVIVLRRNRLEQGAIKEKQVTGKRKSPYTYIITQPDLSPAIAANLFAGTALNANLSLTIKRVVAALGALKRARDPVLTADWDAKGRLYL